VSNVTLDIAGRKFTVACAEGEETHIAMLGRAINGKLLGMPNIANQSEARALLYAALLLADENHELKQGNDGAAAPSGPDVAEPLESLAEKLETLATRLENVAA
jgi:cell division protein ZapA